MKGKRDMKKIISLIMVIVMVSLIACTFASCGDENDTNNTNTNSNEEITDAYKVTHHATIIIRDFGTIELELYGNAAPITVENFEKLANEGFYEGLTFHRIMTNFMIQGGGFTESGAEKDANSIKGEFSSNGVNNPILHERGVISMARTSEPNSASSQFFIMHQTSPHLDGDYAAFGKVTSGIYVVDNICKSVEQGYNGAVSIYDRPVIESITVTKV